MATEQLFVCPLDSRVGIEELYDLFSHQPVAEVEILTNQRTGLPRHSARITLESERTFTPQEINQRFSGLSLENYPIYVTPFRAREEITPPNACFTEASRIAQELGEDDKQPITQIARLLHHCGPDFVQQALQDARNVQAAGGLAVRDGSRMRTLGGVFFAIVRQRTSWKVQQAVFMIRPKAKPAKGGPKRPPNKSARPEQDRPPRNNNRQKQSFDDISIELPPPQPTLPPIDEATLNAARQEYADLLAQYHEAEKEIAAAKGTQGLFSITRKIAGLQVKITQLLSKYPHLES